MKERNINEKALKERVLLNVHGESHDVSMLMNADRLKLPFMSSPRPEIWLGLEKGRL